MPHPAMINMQRLTMIAANRFEAAAEELRRTGDTKLAAELVNIAAELRDADRARQQAEAILAEIALRHQTTAGPKICSTRFREGA